ncbi:hypothetical protein M9Y10_033367 [Tritrichomonas musculus]|uniref:Clan CA, family C1, cathepsin L-like cysteine peptidase n=1 Tax=Tritrichomonas musculus TaxID=1915356 RepID=A0ABR2KF70_9EUKA
MFLFLTSFASCAYILQHEEKSFLSWMRSTNQFFTGDEYKLRLGIFLTNSRLVQQHNSAHKKFTVKLNKFAAYTPSEYQALLGFRMILKRYRETRPSRKLSIANFDWREKGVVNNIKDQGQCGSCYAFSAIQAAESANAIATGELPSFSEQNIVDCATIVDFCYGCDGGQIYGAFDHLIKRQKGKFVLESDYPYLGVDGECQFDDLPHVGSISTYVNIIEGDENDLEAKVQIGPVAVAIDASNWSFQLYNSGIYDEPNCISSKLDHGVGCVGYGSEDGTKYWIVRNSWGTSWGENGYIRMIWKDNQCGIASMACIPSV